MGYGNTTVRTVFPVTVVSPSTPRTTRYYNNAEARTGNRILGIDVERTKVVRVEVAAKTAKVKTVKLPPVYRMPIPKYETEQAVTLAILREEIPFTERLAAYEAAKDYQKWLKKQSRKFIPKKTLGAVTAPGLNNVPGYATAGATV